MMFSDASNIAGEVERVFLFILAISVAILVLITFLMIYFIFKYNRKRHPKAASIEGNLALEVAWTIIPTILVLAMFYYGWMAYKTIREVPEDAMQVRVIGRMWSWLFQYENGIQSDTLYVPYGKPVKLDLQSQDVIHSLFIPAFRVKQDVVPGLNNYLWFQPTQLGTYEVLCTEYCGQQHSYMLTKVVVMSEEEFAQWYHEQAAWKTAQAEAVSGEKALNLESRAMPILKVKGCLACHSFDGSELVGPTFKGLMGKKEIVITEGKERKIIVDEEYIRISIVDPNKDMVQGYQPLMPSQEGLITDDELQVLIDYLKELR
jgi:cytochrome c oxidase subunit 2